MPFGFMNASSEEEKSQTSSVEGVRFSAHMHALDVYPKGAKVSYDMHVVSPQMHTHMHVVHAFAFCHF